MSQQWTAPGLVDAFDHANGLADGQGARYGVGDGDGYGAGRRPQTSEVTRSRHSGVIVCVMRGFVWQDNGHGDGEGSGDGLGIWGA